MKIYFSDFSLILLICFFIFFVIRYSTLKRNPKLYLLILLISLATLAYFFNPVKAFEQNGNYTDLYRFFNDMNLFKQLGWNGNTYLFESNYDSYPLTKLLVYGVSRFDNNHLLPVITVLICYGLTFYVVYRWGKDLSIEYRYIAHVALIFIFLNNYKVCITNIRYPIGLALLLFTIYYDFLKDAKKVICLSLYALLGTIHFALLIFFALRLISITIGRYSKKIILITLLMSSQFLGVITNILNRYSRISYINSILYKLDFYTEGDRSTYYEIPVIFLGLIRILCLYFLIRWVRKNINISNYPKILNLYNFSLIIVSFNLGTIWNYHLFNRTGNFVVFLSLIWMLIFYKNRNAKVLSEKGRKQYLLVNSIINVTVCVHLLYYFLSYQYRVMCF